MKTDFREMTAVVLRSTRRDVILADAEGQVIRASNPPRVLDTVVGDHVQFERHPLREHAGRRQSDTLIKSILPRRNCLKRAVPGREKRLAANLDHLFVVAAVPPLFNTIFIDRIITAAEVEEIPVSIIINKTDLGCDSSLSPYSDYERAGFDLLFVSAREGTGMQELVQALSTSCWKQAAFAGISGVGKSSILNFLLPGAKARVMEVSRKTGQGKQTTSSGQAHEYRKTSGGNMLLIDLPGIQHYGLSHLTHEQLRWAFREFREPSTHCQFKDCSHRLEPGCMVKTYVESGQIGSSRYASYLDIVRELEAAKPY